MRQLTLTTTLFIVFISFATNTFSQVGVSGYSIFALGINTNTDYRLGAEVKLWTNTEVEEAPLEVNLLYNFKARKYHQFSVGAGVNFTPLSEYDHIGGFVFPVALEVFPLQNAKRFSVRVELAPLIHVEGDFVNLRHLWGIRYTFGKDE